MLRVGIDVGGTFTDLFAYDEERRDPLGEGPDDPREPGDRGHAEPRAAAVAPGGRHLPRPRHDDGDERPDRAQGRADRPAHDRGLPRRARDHAHGPRVRLRPARGRSREPLVPRRLQARGAGARAQGRDRRAPARRGARARRDPRAARARRRVDRGRPAALVREPRPRAARCASSSRGRPGAYVSLSSEVNAEYREYERTNTTVVDAYIKPVMVRYISGSSSELETGGLEAAACS